jgi:undecaprenyl diphosphate synthase
VAPIPAYGDFVHSDLEGLMVPKHIAIIMDGNGRWAEQRGLPRLAGHVAGREATRRVVEACRDYQIGALSIYAFSIENWRRPLEEVQGLMELIETALTEELDDLHRNNVRVVASGRLGELPDGLQTILQQARQETADNTGLVLNMLIDYGGRAEIVDAARRFAERVQAGEADPANLNEETFVQGLYCPDLPEPDLVIRPGGEKRISNFLLWEIAYAELVFMDVLWPDFDEPHLLEAIQEFSRRARRFGGLSQPDSLN